MKTPRRTLLLALPVVALSLAACGGPPKGDVALIKANNGNLEISEAQFKRFFNAALANAQQKEVSKLTPLVGPEFTACVAEKKKALPKDSQKKTSDAELKKQCKDTYDQTSQAAMQQLTTLNWVKGEADRRGIKFRKAEVQNALNSIITQQFQGQEGYKTFLKQLGYTQADVDLNVIADLGQKKIVADLQKETKEPTDADVKAYFEQKKKTYVQPETRDLRLIKAKDEATAKLAKADLEAGKSWTATAAKYSTDAASKDQGGKVLATTADQQPPEFGANVFKAKKNELLGPIKTSLGWYVVKIQNITAEKQPVYAELKDQLKQSLATENQQKSVDNFRKLFNERWTGRTVCASGYDDLTVCGGEAADDPAAATTASRPTPRDGGTGLPKDAERRPAEPAAIDPAAAQQVQTAG
ncbi:MAG: peptidyl-prolyl cis-trans isomerase [Solirubrobacteraceae bacterium]|nr:peptidyl-prolyl cis-trans isomerase [Solirubrobacteraceae bacterium]